MRLPRKARALFAGTVIAGIAVMTVAGVKLAALPLGTVALLGAAVVLTELFQVVADEDSPDLADAHNFSFSSGVHIAAILMLGPWAGVVVGAFGVLAVDHLRGAECRKIAFNASSFAISAVLAGYAFELAGGEPGRLQLPHDFPAIAAVAVVYAYVNTLLVSSIVAFISGAKALQLVRASLRAEIAPQAAETGMGASLAFFALTEPWAVVVLFPLFVAMYQAHARLTQLRRETARALETFANIVDERDPYTYRHSARVAEYVEELAERVGLPATQRSRLRWAARLHDLGKVSVDASTLDSPQGLTEDEWAAMRRHPRVSARLLRRFHFASEEARAVEYHHERFDGTGYYGLDARDQPLASHFIIIADSFDAMTTDRPYRSALSREQALAEIEREEGKQFHPAVARAFVALQRGFDPLDALSVEERTQLRTFGKPTRSLRLAPTSLGVGRAELAVIAASAAGLALFGVHEYLPAGVALICALFALGWRYVDLLRARRIATVIRSAVSAPAPRQAHFDAVVNVLGAASDLRWAGLVAWRDADLSGEIDLERSITEGPTPLSLTSWFIREAETGDDLLLASGEELGRGGVYVAVPLRNEGAISAFFVLGFAHGVPRHVEAALRAAAEELGAALSGPASPVVPTRRRSTLAAAAS